MVVACASPPVAMHPHSSGAGFGWPTVGIRAVDDPVGAAVVSRHPLIPA